jgi:hypothetical protein
MIEHVKKSFFCLESYRTENGYQEWMIHGQRKSTKSKKNKASIDHN